MEEWGGRAGGCLGGESVSFRLTCFSSPSQRFSERVNIGIG